MTDPLPDERHAFFAAHGWLIVRGAVDGARVAELERALDAIHRASTPAPLGAVWELPGISRASPAIAAHAHDRAIGALVAAALGCGRVQLLQDTALVKPSHVGGAVEWHQDHTYTGFLRPARAVSVRLALTPCTVDNGCMQVIDGSHLWGPIGAVRALRETRVSDGLGGRAVGEDLVSIELAPGDVSIHHCLTFHRSGPNPSASARKTLITRAFDGACTLAAEAVPAGAAAWFPVDEAGRLAERAFAVIWRSDEESA